MNEAVRIQRIGSEVIFVIDETVYSRRAVLRASHWYTDKFFVSISTAKTGTLAVTLRPKKETTDLDRLVNEFEGVVLDAQLKIEIGDETATIRELIVAKAFAEGDLLDDSPFADWRDPVAQNKKE
jgi:His-Xaa-Ser system protein HxsD